jgi:hypothetical protein
MCFKDGEKPRIPPPPPPPPGLTICKDSGCTGCLGTNGATWGPVTLGGCDAASEKHWGVAAWREQRWLQWLPTFAFLKLDERPAHGGNVSIACGAGSVFVNPQEPARGPAAQGFTITNVSAGGRGAVRFDSTGCPGLCLNLADGGEGGMKLAPCPHSSPWVIKEWR